MSLPGPRPRLAAQGRASPLAGRVLAVCTLFCLAACSARKPIAVRGDGGPAVEVVEAEKHAPDRVKLPLVDEQEPDDTVASAQPMTPGSGIRGSMAAPKAAGAKTVGDDDYYSWMAPGAAAAPDMGFSYARVELTGVAGLDLVLEVLDGDGKRLVSANDGGPGEPELIPNVGVDPAHTYYVRVHEAGVAKGDPTHPYELTVQTFAAAAGEEREPNDDPAHATPVRLTNGTTGEATGFFGRKHDEDWLRLSLAGVPAKDGRATLRVELVPVDGVAVALKVQPDVAVAPGVKPTTKADKAPAFAEARAGKNEELRLRNVGVDVAGGTALIALRATEGKSTETRWQVRLGLEPPLDGAEREPNGDVAHATSLVLNGGTAQLAGFLWPGDADVYRVTGATPDTFVTVEVEGVDKVDLKLERLGADGKAQAKADDAPAGQGEMLPPAKLGDGLYRVSARAHDTAFDAPYRIIATVVTPAPDEEREPNDSAASATPWLPGATAMHGRLAPRGDEDWYALTGDGSATTARVDGPIPATARIVDEGRLPVAPGAALVSGKRYFVVVKATSDK
ncbi:MAG TPA: hypothetical protein VIA18_31295, partial [Polyangia bacterium]|nr:hypothetical protein [Polyangia bacterium]